MLIYARTLPMVTEILYLFQFKMVSEVKMYTLYRPFIDPSGEKFAKVNHVLIDLLRDIGKHHHKILNNIRVKIYSYFSC